MMNNSFKCKKRRHKCLLLDYSIVSFVKNVIIILMKRYAFIDVLNTQNTSQHMLGFVVDWNKLCDYLKNNKSCKEVILYTGIDNGDQETAKEFETVSKISCCAVKSKPIFSYKNKDRVVAFKCLCGEENIHTINMGYTKKSNCDVELSVDVMERAEPETEMYIYTADGDFEYLIRKALEKGVNKIYIVSYAGKNIQVGLTDSRFSTKLRNLINEKNKQVIYISLKDIKHIIKKDIAILT